MGDNTVDALTRRAADAASRRRSLISLGGAALAAGLVAPAMTAAKKGGNKSSKQCKKQVDACREGLVDLCEVVFGPSNVEECVDFFAPCCEFLKGCKTAQALACATDVAASIQT